MDTSKPGAGAGPEFRARKSPRAGESQSIVPDQFPQSIGSEASSAKDAAMPLAADMKDAAKTVGRAAKDQASAFAANVGQELSRTAEAQKVRGAEAIQSFARAITSAAAEIETQSPQAARSVRDAASKVEGLSRNLRNHSVDDLLKVGADLARRQPMLFVGGALAAGFAVSRFLRSSSRDQTLANAEPDTPAKS
jgi:hypothetical protein